MGCGIKLVGCGISLAVQWLNLHISTAGSMGSLCGQGTKILHAVQQGKKKIIQLIKIIGRKKISCY